MGIQIIESIFARISGASIMDVHHYDSSKLRHCFNDINRLQAQKNELIYETCERLYTSINISTSRTERNFLLNLKRDIYNNRPVNPYKHVDREFHIDITIAHKLDELNKINNQISCYENIAKEYFHKSLELEIIALNTFCKNDLFKKGLLLSSDYLFDYIIDRTFSIEDFEKTKVEIFGLWKYVTRMVAKTSPFSTFTNLAIGKINDNSICFSKTREQLCSKISYNRSIYRVLQNIIVAHPDINRNLCLRINRTFFENGNTYRFLITTYGKDVFQTVEASGILQYTIDVIRRKKIVKYEELVCELCNVSDNIKDDIYIFVDNLLKTGIIEYEIGLNPSEINWDEMLLALFENVFLENGNDRYSKMVKKLCELKEQYSASTALSRKVILSEMSEMIKKIILDLHEGANLPFYEREYMVGNIQNARDLYEKSKKDNAKSKFEFDSETVLKNQSTSVKLPFRNIIYEDTVTEFTFDYNDSNVKKMINDISYFESAFSFYNSFKFNAEEFLTFFQKKFDDKQKIKVLEFYEMYCKSKYHSREERLFKTDSKAMEKYYFFQDKLIELFSEYVDISQESEIIYLDKTFLEKIEKEFSIFIAPEKKRLSAIVQIFLDENKSMQIAINHILQGTGKAAGRFIYLFGDAVAENIKNINNLDKENEIQAEIITDSYFNANTHPPLTSHQLLLQGLYAESNSINVKLCDLYVKNLGNKIILCDESERRVYPIDLGIETRSTRPLLYRFLCQFEDQYYFNIERLYNVFGFRSLSENITFFPRIVYENSIIICRKHWIIKIEEFSKLKIVMSKENFFYLINQWRIGFSIPDEVFIKSYQNEYSEESNLIENNKPQYINFLSPLCVQLLRKIINSTKHKIFVEEMLPCSRQLLCINDKPHVAEFILHWK